MTYEEAAALIGKTPRDVELAIAGCSPELVRRLDGGFEFTEAGRGLGGVLSGLKATLPDLPTAHLWAGAKTK